MSKSTLLLLTALGIAPLAGCATIATDSPDTAGEQTLFAAMIMTKEQQASSVPTDSGILLRDPESGEWHKLGPSIQMISSATSDPNDPDTLYFACGNGIVRSRDGGETWRLVTGWRESDVLQIAIDPENSDNLYAATAWGVTVSRDGGDTWKAANDGLPEYLAKGIVLDERRPERILLATTTGLFESTNRARSWQRVDAFPRVAALRLKRSESDPDTWIAGTEGAGAWISRDDAKTWQPAVPALADENIYAVAIDPFDAAHMAAGGWGTGVHISTDGGETWNQAREDLPSPNITTLLFDRNTPGRLWASTFEEGTFHTDSLGESWSPPELSGAYVFDLGYL